MGRGRGRRDALGLALGALLGGWALGACAMVAPGLGAPPAATPTPGGPAPIPTREDGTIAGELRVFAAASLADAFREVGVMLESANPGSGVAFNFAGSPALRTQLREGARADLFAAADEPTMRGAQADGTIADDPRVFARSRLVAIVPRENRAGLRRLQDFARPGLKIVLAQRDVPVGAYARQALERAEADGAFGPDFSRRVLANVVSEESNVRQVVGKVGLGEADAGIVYATDVTPAARATVEAIEIPERINVVASYPIAIVRGAPNEESATSFVRYLLSPPGQATLARHGFSPVGATS